MAPARRAGFTLVELMVSAAVSVIIMAILATVFQSGIDTMRDMRSVGGLQDQLRSATEMIRRDLQAPHFVPATGAAAAYSGPRLSDQKLNAGSAWKPPVGGFFHIESDASWGKQEGGVPDQDQLYSTRSTNSNFLIHFTSILAGDRPQNMYAAATSSNVTINSPAAEVAYFLDPTNNPTSATSGGTATLYQLFRRQRLVARANADKPSLQSTGLSALDRAYVAMPASIPPFNALSLNDLAGAQTSFADSRLGGLNSANRTAGDQNVSPLQGSRAGDDVLLSNVISFEIKANWDGDPPPSSFSGNTDYPFDYLSTAGKNTFDTGWNNDPATAPLKIRVKAIQIKLRIYDPQTKVTRQVTIVQDM